MNNPVEASLTILMMCLVLEIVSESSISCIQHGDETCYGHTLTCKDGNVIWIKEAMFGYRRGCGQPIPLKNKNCSSRCCQYLETDCIVRFSDAELQEVNSDCSKREQCKFTKLIYHFLQNPECQDRDAYANSYSKINYTCVGRSEYHKLSSTASTSIWPWTTTIRVRSSQPPSIKSKWTRKKLTLKQPMTSPTKSMSSVQPSSRINRPSVITAITVPSSSLNDSSHTVDPMEVAVTKSKVLTDQQSNKQSSDTGAVIGGIVSGVILMVVLVVISVYFIKRRRMNPKQASKRHTPNNVSRGIRISAPIALQNTTNTTIAYGQHNGGSLNSKSEYENIDLETPIDPTTASGVYYQLEANSLPTIYSRLELETTAELQHPGGDIYNHLGEDNPRESNLDISDYNHTSDVCEYSDNYHHIRSTDDFKTREANLVDCEYSHIQDTSEDSRERI